MDAADYPGASNESGDLSIIRPLSACGSHQQHVSYGGYFHVLASCYSFCMCEPWPSVLTILNLDQYSFIYKAFQIKF